MRGYWVLIHNNMFISDIGTVMFITLNIGLVIHGQIGLIVNDLQIL